MSKLIGIVKNIILTKEPNKIISYYVDFKNYDNNYNYINLLYCLKGKCKLHIHEPVHNSNLSLVSQIQCIKYFDSFYP